MTVQFLENERQHKLWLLQQRMQAMWNRIEELEKSNCLNDRNYAAVLWTRFEELEVDEKRLHDLRKKLESESANL